MKTEDVKNLRGAFLARYTPAFIRQLADQGTKVLKDIPRWEDFAGMGKVIMAADGTRVLIHRDGKDYERPRFEPNERAMFRACDQAIRDMGQRIDLTLQGEPIARDFMGGRIRSAMHPATWAGGSCLYSLGPAPQLLDSDGIVIFRLYADGHDGSDDKLPVYREDMLEARFGFYGNTGPIDHG